MKLGLNTRSNGGPIAPFHGSHTGYIFVSRVDAIVSVKCQIVFDPLDQPGSGPAWPDWPCSAAC